MSDDLVSRLRTATVASGANPTYVQALQEAADEIERLQAENKEMAGLLWEFMENTNEIESATMYNLHRASTKLAVADE